ncbi:MAG: carbohydrate binding domain-containing protein [Halobacteriota archaeon]|nr:carbohydrate binding domain-containing protein [Halobacteriota archaeon]
MHKLRYTLIFIFILIILFTPLIAGYPLLTGDLNGKLRPQPVPNNYKQLDQWLREQGTEFKVAVYPCPPPWGVTKPTIQSNLYWQHIESQLLNNQSDDVGKLLSVWNVRYVIVRGDALQSEAENLILARLSDQSDLRLIKTLGSLQIFENENYANHVYIPTQSTVSTLENLVSISNIESFTSANSSLFFLDQTISDNKYNHTLTSDVLLLNEDPLDLSLSFLDDKYIIKPFHATNHHNPSRMWSKAATNDPLHGEWHPYLEERDIENWDFDYGKGLVFTWAPSIFEWPSKLREEDLLVKFDFEDGLGEWSVNSEDVQKIFLSDISYQGEDSIGVELYNSSEGWKTLNSPLVPVRYGDQYNLDFHVKCENAHLVHAKITEYDSDGNVTTDKNMGSIGDGIFDWKSTSFNFVPSSSDTKFIQLQIWYGHETDKPLPNKVWIDDVRVYDLSGYLKPNSLNVPFEVESDGSYELFIRYFQNKDGGNIGVYLDRDLIDIIGTEDQINGFVWKNIKNLTISEGKHTITIENREGFNAVNIFSLIPKEEYEKAEKELYELIKDKRIIYVFEAESDLYGDTAGVLNVGGEASNGGVVLLPMGSKVWKNINIPKDGDYRIALRLNGSALMKIDNQTFEVNSTGPDFVYINVNLSKGEHRIEVIPMKIDPGEWIFGEFEEAFGKEFGNLSRLHLMALEVYNFDFERYLGGWSGDAPPIYTLSINNGYGGDCVKAELRDSTWGWKTINSPLVPVTYGNEYIWEFKIKGENAHAVHAKITEYDSDGNVTTDKNMGSIGDETFDWKNITFGYIPSQNASYIQLQIWHGHNTTKPLPNIIWIDDVRTYGYSPPSLDVLWLYSTESENESLGDIFSPGDTPAEVISYEKIDPTRYIVKVKAQEPFMLSFAESYDPLWAAYVGDREYEPIPLYSVINGFLIDETGDVDVTIEYKPQRWFYYGAGVSILSLVGCIGYLIYDWRKKN